MKKEKQKPQIYSALEVANICGVVNQTAINWIKSNYVKAFKTPGGQYRVYPEDLVVFMKSRGMNVPQFLLDSCTQNDEYISKSLLIVDDDKGLNSVIAKYLLKKFANLEIFQAFDGFEAGALMSQEKPGCVILDLDLPGVDGFSLCERINKDDSFNAPDILVITALQDSDVEKRIESIGIKKFMRKPLNLSDLAACVETWLERK